MGRLRELWRTVTEALTRLGAVQLFFIQLLLSIPQSLLRLRLIVYQIYILGALSLVLIMVSGLFIGMVLGFQGYNTLVTFGATEALGTVVALSLLRELGPVVTALLYAGRAGTSLASEIGLMRATDQLAGMEMMAVDPVKRVLVPRFLGGVVAMPLLAAIFNAIGIFGGYIVGVTLMGVDSGTFWSHMNANVELYDDILGGIIKSVVFGVTATLLALFEGYNAPPTAEGVSRATTRTVVGTALTVLALDYVLTALMFTRD